MSSLLEMFMLWFMMAAMVGMVVLSARARSLEQAQGLASSARRLVTVSVLCAIVVVLVLLATVSLVLPRHPRAFSERPLTTEPIDPTERDKLDALEKRKAELFEEIARIDAEIDKLLPVPPPLVDELERPWYRFNVAPLAHFVVPILVMIGTLALVSLGDPTTLLRSGWAKGGDEDDPEKQAAVVGLDRLSQLVERGEYQQGLKAAGSVDVGALDKFDRLDWAYFKNYCAVQVAALDSTDSREKEELLATTVRDLDTLLEQAPNRGEAVYLLATANGLSGRWKAAFDGFAKAASLLQGRESKLPFPENESVCWLHMAEDALGKGDAEEAARLFDQVTKRGVLVDRIPAILVKVRLLKVRRSLQEGNHDEAQEGIDAFRKVEGVDAQQRRDVETVCDALETLIAVRQGDPPAIVDQTERFMDRHVPRGFPPPEEDIVDEYLDVPISGIDLRLSPKVFRAFLFLQAEARSKIAAKAQTPLTETEARVIARPLFRALQFELRQRDVLAALGGLYYWFVPDGRKKAIEWLEAAVAMGAVGRIARGLLEAARAHELEHREALDWFRATSIRFLHDPTIAKSVRRALIEELGRFQEFQPLLIDIESSLETQPREPTLRLLRQRAGYLEKTVSDLASRNADSISPRVQELLKDYQGLIAHLDESTGRITEIEGKLVREFGRIVMS